MTPIDMHCRAPHFDNAPGEPCLLGLCFLHHGIADKLYCCTQHQAAVHTKRLCLSCLHQDASHTNPCCLCSLHQKTLSSCAVAADDDEDDPFEAFNVDKDDMDIDDPGACHCTGASSSDTGIPAQTVKSTLRLRSPASVAK